MNDKTIYILNFIAILGTGLIAGVFLAFSSFIMSAFGRLSPANGISAMQMINVTVINPLFMSVLFGTAAICLGLVFASFRTGLGASNQLLLAGATLYLLGAIGVTMVFNVPLNDGLATVDATNPNSITVWTNYLQSWTFWNSVRGLAACAACAMFVRAINIQA